MRLSDSRSMVDVLRDRAAAQPDDLAYTFLDDGERQGPAITWAALERLSRAVACAIQRQVEPGSRVLIVCPPSVDFVPAFFGVLYAGAIAVPAYPPSGARADRAAARLRGMITDAGISLVLAPSCVMTRASALAGTIPELAAVPWINLDEVDHSLADDWRAPHLHGDSIAFLQYTSGSTATPRGVMVTHGNLFHNLMQTQADGRYSRESICVSWLPVTHDMGLINGVLQPAFSGCRTFLMAPAAFLQRPARWLQAISRLGATHSGGPNFAYDLCTRRLVDSDREGLDLSSWQVAYNGSEPVRRSTLEKFQRAFGASGFRWEAFSPAYGLAESTLLVSSVPAEVEPAFHDERVASGILGSDSGVAIVDPSQRTRCAAGAIGEIWVRSRSVALGYWKRPDDTDVTFRAMTSDTREGPFLRSGDLGYVKDGRLYVTGRIKDVLIVRGMKHYPQDLEATVEQAHPAVRPGCCAAVAVEADDQERIAIVAEVEPRVEAAASAEESQRIVLAIRLAVASEHQVSPSIVALVGAGSLPKTTSGKLQRYLCRGALMSGGFDLLASWREEGPMERAS